MSARQLRKLQKQREQELGGDLDSQANTDSADDSDVPQVTAPKPRVNLFAALGGDNDTDNDDDEPDKEHENEEPIDEPEPAPAPTAAKKSKKKKKKKAKAKQVDDVTPKGEANTVSAESEDEIDKAMKELNLKPANATAAGSEGSNQRDASLQAEVFGINPYHLKAMNEMRNLFGKDVIESAQAEEESANPRRRMTRREMRQNRQLDLETFLKEPPGAPKLPEISLRRNVFIQGREHWPKQSAGGLTMKEIGVAPDGLSTEYTYAHDTTYDEVQSLFFATVQLGDPMRLVHLLKRFPYHVSTCLQVSFVAKQDQNMALASELCERALFSFGRVTTTGFRNDIEKGRARLDFRRPENRQLWLSGYQYLRNLLRKGTFRTALEWTKLLYSLDPSDPYALRHYAHFLGVRAYEGTWLLKFLDDLERSDAHEDTIYLQQSRVLALLQLGDNDGAKEALQAGIQKVPWLYSALFQELNLDTPPSIWGISAQSDARQFWVKLYLHLAKDLWNNTAATDLLVKTAGAMGKVEVSALPVDDTHPDLGATRLVYLEGATDIISVAPRDLLDMQPNYEFDPLPPAEEDNIFTGQGTRLPWDSSRQEHQGRVNDLLAQIQGALPGRGMGLVRGMDDGDSDDEVAEDMELERDLQAAAARANQPGMLDALMQMVGLRRAPAAAGSGDAVGGAAEDNVPGTWPESDEEA